MDVRTARALFDRSAPSYDRVNTAVSLGLDARWRHWAASRAVTVPGARVLDAYCGTGLVGLAAAREGAAVTFADASPAMLEAARARMHRARVHASFAVADLSEDRRPLPGSPFDAITVVFGIRYMDDPAATLRRLSALLVPGGRLVVVEFVPLPADAPLLQRIAARYFFRLLPSVAGRLAGDRSLYDYLRESTLGMGSSERIDSWLREAALTVTASRSMGFGLVYGAVATQV